MRRAHGVSRRERGPKDLGVTEALAGIEKPQAGLLLEDPEPPRWSVFTPAGRVTAHAHHARKYADTYLPDHQAFRFQCTDGLPVVAHNVIEFHSAVQTVPLTSLRHHLINGDFSRWIADVIGDEQLAHGLRKLERTVAGGASPDRGEILAHIEDHYQV